MGQRVLPLMTHKEVNDKKVFALHTSPPLQMWQQQQHLWFNCACARSRPPPMLSLIFVTDVD